MCCTLQLANGKEIDSVRELKTIYPNLVWFEEAYESLKKEDDQCLCWVNIQATCAAYGDTVEHNPSEMLYSITNPISFDQAWALKEPLMFIFVRRTVRNRGTFVSTFNRDIYSKSHVPKVYAAKSSHKRRAFMRKPLQPHYKLKMV